MMEHKIWINKNSQKKRKNGKLNFCFDLHTKFNQAKTICLFIAFYIQRNLIF